MKGLELAGRLKAKGIKLKDVAESIGIAKSTLSRYLHDEKLKDRPQCKMVFEYIDRITKGN